LPLSSSFCYFQWLCMAIAVHILSIIHIILILLNKIHACIWHITASALCWEGNAWEYNFSLQVRIIVWKINHSTTLNLQFFDCCFYWIFRYTMFWVLLIITKLTFSYYIEVCLSFIFLDLPLLIESWPAMLDGNSILFYC